MPSLDKIGTVILEKIASMYFRYFVNIHPLTKGVTLLLNKIEFSLPKEFLCQVWLEIARWFWRRNFKIIAFSLSPLGKESGPSLERT